MIDLAQRAQRIQILKAEGPSPYISRLMEEVGHHFTVFNGRNGVELIDNLRAGCAGTIPGVECCDFQAGIYDLWHLRENLELPRQNSQGYLGVDCKNDQKITCNIN